MQQFERAILWGNLYTEGTEYCAIGRDSDAWLLDGTVAQVHEGRPLRVHYEIRCNPTWETRIVHIEVALDGQIHRLHLTVDAQHRWWSDGAEIPALQGCVDVDLSITPATNTLPIRRLTLPVGSSERVLAAWVRFPDLSVEALPQRYTRLAATCYRYESGDGAFTVELDVDDLGLVRHYPGRWHAEAIS